MNPRPALHPTFKAVLEPAERLARRTSVVRAGGAPANVIAEVLSYNENRFDVARLAALELPLADEPFVSWWQEQEPELAGGDVAKFLRPRLVQLQFPIEEGMSRSAEYRAATLSGVAPRGNALALALRDPAGLRFELMRGAAGGIPVLTVADRDDFVSLFRALCKRNEPVPISSSVGGCIIGAYNNWERIRLLERNWQAQHPGASADAWTGEFHRIRQQKQLYQDRLILLSSGAYSGVAAAEIGVAAKRWDELSHQIRIVHEYTHYFTYRVFGSVRNRVLDELIADYAGITAAFGEFRSDLFFRFLRIGPYASAGSGRFLEYRASPQLSAAAVFHLGELLVRAARNVERFDRVRVRSMPAEVERMIMTCTLAHFTIEELNAGDTSERLSAVLDQTRATLTKQRGAAPAAIALPA